MTAVDWKRGIWRLCVALCVLWVIGMGAYQYQAAQQADSDSVTISLDKDTELRIDASGIRKNDTSSVLAERLEWIFLPPLLLLLMVPAGLWLARGFKKEG